jgi:hypothetical protein
MTYEYKNLIEDGYVRIYLTKKEHNIIFKNFRLKFFESAEYYHSDINGTIIIQKYISNLATLIEVILFPISLLFFGISNFKEIVKELKKLIYKKKYGSFQQETVYKRNPEYSKILLKIK